MLVPSNLLGKERINKETNGKSETCGWMGEYIHGPPHCPQSEAVSPRSWAEARERNAASVMSLMESIVTLFL